MVQRNRTIVAVGYFDGVHIGHRELFRKAKEIADRTGYRPIAITFDFSTAQRPSGKGASDLYQREESFRIMRELGVEPEIIRFEDIADLSPNEFIHGILISGYDAEYILSSKDFRFGRGRSAGVSELKELCAAYGIRSVTVEEELYGGRPVSTARIKELVANGDVATAGKMLGEPYHFSSVVAKGKGLGRQIGCPTINQVFPNILRPARGVYASVAEVDGIEYHSVTDIGIRPTVEVEGEYRAETHIIDLNEDLLGKEIRVYLLRRLRDEKKFSSVDELVKAIHMDRQEALN